MPAITAAERLSSFGSRKVKRLFRSTSEVTFALPASLRKISRSASQCPNASRVPTSAGRFSIQRSRGIGGAARPAAVAAPAPPARLGQVAVQAVLPALRAVDVAVDGLVADRRPAVRLFLSQPAGDLLRRPAGL